MKSSLFQLAIVLLLFPGCSSASRNGDATRSPEPVDPEIARQGTAHYADWGCADCHGDDGRGMEGIPALVGLRQDWNVAELASYLADPARYGEGHPRIRELRQRYPDFEMPAYDFAVEAERRALAAWLLASPWADRAD